MWRISWKGIREVPQHGYGHGWEWSAILGWPLLDRSCDQARAGGDQNQWTRFKIPTGTAWNRSFLETGPNRIRPRHRPIQMKVPFTLGEVGHFGLAVRDPKKSAKWFERALGLRKEFEFENGVAVGNDYVTIALLKGKPSPETIDHMSFH